MGYVYFDTDHPGVDADFCRQTPEKFYSTGVYGWQ